jgi:hypothetical protein
VITKVRRGFGQSPSEGQRGTKWRGQESLSIVVTQFVPAASFTSRDPVAPHSSNAHSFISLLCTTTMDLNSSHSTFFSRVYAAPQSSNKPSYLSATRPQASTPSFFGKSHIPHSAGRRSEPHTIRQDDGSASLPPADTEDGSIYAGHKNHRYFSRSIEGANSRHPHGNMNEGSRVPHALKSGPALSTGQAGTLQNSVLSL